ncbi:LamG-like jellyroll fold domain-containing protein [Streptomyces arboris]|uniref:LamG domain-containing protein n=1 Tax=Streptomyces arboris TaxID=2600619 RepID=A0A5N5EN57_9ACTN|nr:LamG-like jellyroll fold domain-containing protein [Streptomyces arboris]KAB2590122.1 LamG domain-containing protein [Streptomyces arboris]
MVRRTGAGRLRRARRAAAVAVIAAGTVLATPGTVLAASTTLPPKQPLTADLETGGEPCVSGDERPYAMSVPRLTARLYGPGDGQPGQVSHVRGEFEAWWQGEDGAEERVTTTTGTLSDTTPFGWQLPETIPDETVVSWRVRAVNDVGASAWSSEGAGSACEFVYDRTRPDAPVVTSSDYPDDNTWTPGVGVRGTFHVKAQADDVVAYAYSFMGGGSKTVRPGPDGTAEIRFVPQSAGVQTLSVQAQDRAGNRSSSTNYTFRIGSGPAPVAQWKLTDAAGSRSAAAETGTAARAGAGVTFGAPAPSGTPLTSTASLDGSGHGFLTPGAPVVADTAKDFAVGGWVRPGRVDGTRTVLSQDAGTARAFTLGLTQAAGGPKWSFSVGGARVTGGLPEAGAWAYVLGQYDAETGTARLYVNGRAAGEEVAAVPVAGEGAFQIGRARGAQGYRDRWQGEIGDVRAYDRIVVASEVKDLATRAARRLGHWALDTAPDGLAPEEGGGAPLKLGTGASLYRLDDAPCDWLDPDCVQDFPLEADGDGHLRLDGVSGHAATDAPVVDTSGSFTVSVRVRLTDDEPAAPMTAISQGGEHGDAFKVRFDPENSSWDLVLAHADAPGAPETVLRRIEAPDGNSGVGHRVTVVHDASVKQVFFYLDGVKYAEGGTADFDAAWKSTGGLQLGRGRTADGWGEYLHGAVDSVFAYEGVLSETDIRQLPYVRATGR